MMKRSDIADGSETLSMNVFPNPAMEFTNISFNYNGKPADISISVINTLGNIVGEYFDEFVEQWYNSGGDVMLENAKETYIVNKNIVDQFIK